MNQKDVMSVQDLLTMNEMMLGRGMPVQRDGIGYNQADFGACSTYFYGLSDAQVADLAKRLVKYSNTQLHIDKQLMKDTAEYYAEKVKHNGDRRNGISIEVKEDGTLIGFSYNEMFIEAIKALPKSSRQFNAENKCWVVKNDRVIPLLNELFTLGADVSNALEYAMNHEHMQNVVAPKEEKIEIQTKYDGEFVLLKFEYNKRIVDAIKSINYKDRKYNADYKFWSVKKTQFETLREILYGMANFTIK